MTSTRSWSCSQRLWTSSGLRPSSSASPSSIGEATAPGRSAFTVQHGGVAVGPQPREQPHDVAQRAWSGSRFKFLATGGKLA